MRTRYAGPLSPFAIAALAVAAAGWGCSREADTYRGPRFEIHKPSAPGWTLTARPEEFRIKPPAAPEDRLGVAGPKTVERKSFNAAAEHFAEALRSVQFH